MAELTRRRLERRRSQIPGVRLVSPSRKLAPLDSAREEVFRRVDAGSASTLALFEVPGSMTPEETEEILRGCESGRYAVFCHHNAILLAQLYRQRGFDADVINFGITDAFTHAGVLVEIEGERYYEDGYFNFSVPKPFFEVLDEVRRGKDLPVALGKAGVKRVRVSSLGEARWLDPDAVVEGSAGGNLICRVRWSLEPFALRDPLMRKALDRQAELGAPPTVAGLFLFPYAVYDGKRYHATPERSALLDRYIHAAGFRGGDEPTRVQTDAGNSGASA